MVRVPSGARPALAGLLGGAIRGPALYASNVHLNGEDHHMSTNTLLIIVVLILLFGGGWGWSRRGR